MPMKSFLIATIFLALCSGIFAYSFVLSMGWDIDPQTKDDNNEEYSESPAGALAVEVNFHKRSLSFGFGAEYQYERETETQHGTLNYTMYPVYLVSRSRLIRFPLEPHAIFQFGPIFTNEIDQYPLISNEPGMMVAWGLGLEIDDLLAEATYRRSWLFLEDSIRDESYDLKFSAWHISLGYRF